MNNPAQLIDITPDFSLVCYTDDVKKIAKFINTYIDFSVEESMSFLEELNTNHYEIATQLIKEYKKQKPLVMPHEVFRKMGAEV